jgi:hypothetical protein
MRTTIDLPDELYRSLKIRAASRGMPLRQLVQHLVEQGLRTSRSGESPSTVRRAQPPVIILPTGVPILAISRATLKRLDEAEDEAKHARSA